MGVSESKDQVLTSKNGVSVHRKYFKNGNVKYEYNYKNYKIDGIYREWYANGRLKSIRNYVNDSIEGLFIEWYQNGLISKEGRYKNNKLTGICKLFNKNSGKLAKEIYYKHGKKNGLLIEFGENGNKLFEFNYKNNKKNGLQKKYFENVNFENVNFENVNNRVELEYTCIDDIQCGMICNWYENGKKRSEYNLINGVKNGTVNKWYENGNRRYKGNFVDGKKHGTFKKWHENGDIKSKLIYNLDIVAICEENKSFLNISTQFLQDLQKVEFITGKLYNVDYLDCSICLENIKEKQVHELIATHCGHIFCQHCALGIINKPCPNCRFFFQ